MGLLCIVLLFALTSCVKAPDAVGPVPTAQQVEWQKLETYAFVHFGLNTFNDMEWGYGNTPSATFNPTDLDCEQWVRTLKACGMKAVILTAKHHDGFCLWQTNTTNYSIKNSPYKNGRGDMVRELSDACKKHGLKFGLYLSPWDRNNADYGKPEYVETYHAQIKELASNYGSLFEFWFDGANGGNGWYGGADEVRSIDPKSYYDYERARNTIFENNPNAMIFGGTVPTIRWIGNEQGIAGDTQWSIVDTEKTDDLEHLNQGSAEGKQWLPSEADVSIRPGWFYHAREDHQVKTVSQLVDIYYRSVGHNANLLLNFPVGLSGKIYPVDSFAAIDFYKAIQSDFKENLLQNCKVTADNERGKRFSAQRMTDENWDTYWSTEDGINQGEVIFDFPQKTALNRIVIQEYIPLGQRVERFGIDRMVAGRWLPVEAYDELTTVGYKRIIRFETIEADKIRIRFKKARGPLCINNVEAYCAPALLSEPNITRDVNNMVRISSDDRNTLVYYTLDGTDPTTGSTLYKAPFEAASKTSIKAVSYDPINGNYSSVGKRDFDISINDFKVIFPPDELMRRVFDGNGTTVYYLTEDKPYIELKLNKKMKVSGFRYLPNQARDANRHIAFYQFIVNGKEVSSGEFSNIKNNPVAQEVRFDAVEGDILRFVGTGNVDGSKSGGVAELEIITD
jgi:Alpha-L-fucosidase